MKFVSGYVHGCANASGRFSYQVTLTERSWEASKSTFKEYYNFFDNTYGPSVDSESLMLLKESKDWSWKVGNGASGQHTFYLKSAEQLNFFLLKFGEYATQWD
jgi:hypothetical protein